MVQGVRQRVTPLVSSRSQVGPLSRLQLVSDSLEMARLGRSAYQPALRMVDHLAKDPSPLVWRAALPHLLLLHRQLRSRRDALALRVSDLSSDLDL